MKLRKKQLDSIKNAKTNIEAFKAFQLIEKPALKKYIEIDVPDYKTYRLIVEPAYKL